VTGLPRRLRSVRVVARSEDWAKLLQVLPGIRPCCWLILPWIRVASLARNLREVSDATLRQPYVPLQMMLTVYDNLKQGHWAEKW